ncbi:hypothetical protein MO973_29755 [Paenibacillus sp. TRM 82003]|uniref:hypothetical protein n=1 Tax=Kineococcus sp. TRM81007 TaxID=2925831 RepID=UPI001F5837C2|nr:hypothetical protein [Kineococcus sp. TRM81007]MCI2238989.1 hypothetical protein [Kineococcus sp. TRM81007]MCI3924409.1 hypothetical protein [Paenibacillus sp. TRM 82003]
MTAFSPPPPASSSPAWLTDLLERGRCPDPSGPWRPGPSAAARAATVRDVRDGLLRRVVGDVVVAAGVQADTGVRARALGLLVPPGAVVVGWAAAWVHVGAPLPPPQQVQVVRPGAARHRSVGGVRLVASRCLLDEREVVDVAGLALTCPARTLLDVARTAPRSAARLRELLTASGVDSGDVELAVRRARGRAHVRTARRALAAAPVGR